MLTLYYAPGACSLAAHIVLEESGEKYEARRVDFSKAEQRSEAYLKINPQGRVPVLLLDNGEPLAENTAILPYLGKRFGLWPKDAAAEARALSLIGFFAASVHPAHAHISQARALRQRQVLFPRHPGAGAQDLPAAPEADRRAPGRPAMALGRLLRARCLCLHLLHLGRAPRGADGGDEELHRPQGPHAARPAVRRVVDDEKVKV